MAKIETVAIRRNGNRVLVNRVDYDGKDPLWTDEVKKETPKIIEEAPVEVKAEETPVIKDEDTEPEKKVLKKKLLKK